MRILWPALLALALTACSGVMITRDQALEASTEVHWRYLGSVGAVETTVLAGPFADEDIRRAMSAAGVEPRLRYVATRPANEPYSYRVVVAFGGWPVGGDSYCRNLDLRPGPATTGLTEMQAVFCLGPITLVEAAGRTAPVDSAGDPRFNRLVSSLLVALQSPSRPSDME